MDLSFTVAPAATITTVTFEAGPYTYRGSAFTATAAVTGAGGLNQLVPVVYSGDCTNVTGANGCTATATFAGGTNHNGSTDSQEHHHHARDDDGQRDGLQPARMTAPPHGASATATGVGGASTSVPVVYLAARASRMSPAPNG